jgi:hypothetical protein
VSGGDPALEEGWVGRELALEFPELRLVSVVAPAPGRRTPSAQRERLALLADRFHGARALTLRREPVPHAYRVFFRQVGLDPDAQRTPVEAAALDRLVHGGFASRGALEDALLVAVVETGVPVWALDADVVDEGGPGIRAATDTDRERGASVSPGSLAVADRFTVHAPLFGDPFPGHAAGPSTRRLVLFTLGVDGVPAIHIEECLWTCLEWLR